MNNSPVGRGAVAGISKGRHRQRRFIRLPSVPAQSPSPDNNNWRASPSKNVDYALAWAAQLLDEECSL
jgi:hypothetical protein